MAKYKLTFNALFPDELSDQSARDMAAQCVAEGFGGEVGDIDIEMQNVTDTQPPQERSKLDIADMASHIVDQLFDDLSQRGGHSDIMRQAQPATLANHKRLWIDIIVENFLSAIMHSAGQVEENKAND